MRKQTKAGLFVCQFSLISTLKLLLQQTLTGGGEGEGEGGGPDEEVPEGLHRGEEEGEGREEEQIWKEQ